MATSAEHLPDDAAPDRKAVINEMVGRAVEHLLGRGHHAPLAAHIGVAPSGISRRIKGETAWSAAEVRLAAEFFRKPVAQLYTDPDTWEPPSSVSPHVHGPSSQGTLLMADLAPAFNFHRSAPGLVGIAS
jgi:hypothetical protein